MHSYLKFKNIPIDDSIFIFIVTIKQSKFPRFAIYNSNIRANFEFEQIE